MHLLYNVGYSKQPNLQKVSDLSQAPIDQLMKKGMYHRKSMHTSTKIVVDDL